MKIVNRIVCILLFFYCLSCEEEFIPDIPENAPEIVVEGYIEGGDQPAPPYVILTRSIPFFSQVNANVVENLFVHDAIVTVQEGEQEVVLTEICWDDLNSTQRAQAAELFGIEANKLQINFCVYVDLTFSMFGEIGKRYDLKIETTDQVLTASTLIPPHIPLDSLKFVAPPGKPNDTLTQLRSFIKDPSDETNFYRYFTQVNSEPMFPGFPSVTDDRLFNGQNFEFPLSKADSRERSFEEVDLATIGLFVRGDTVTLKWCTLDQAHFRFWETLEFNAANQGPFSSYTRIESNVAGGLGIWGGYANSFYEQIVPQ